MLPVAGSFQETCPGLGATPASADGPTPVLPPADTHTLCPSSSLPLLKALGTIPWGRSPREAHVQWGRWVSLHLHPKGLTQGRAS